MATPSSILAWTIPWTEEPGGLQTMGSQRAGCDWATGHAHNGFRAELFRKGRGKTIHLFYMNSLSSVIKTLFLPPYYFDHDLAKSLI